MWFTAQNLVYTKSLKLHQLIKRECDKRGSKILVIISSENVVQKHYKLLNDVKIKFHLFDQNKSIHDGHFPSQSFSLRGSDIASHGHQSNCLSILAKKKRLFNSGMKAFLGIMQFVFVLHKDHFNVSKWPRFNTFQFSLLFRVQTFFNE